MDWKRILKRKRWLINIPTILWAIIWEFIKDAIIQATRDYFTQRGLVVKILYVLLQNPVIVALIVLGIVFLWAYLDTKREKINELKIEIQDCKINISVVFNSNPSMPTNLLAVSTKSSLQKITEVELTAKFIPEGEIKIDSLKLHIGGNSYKANELPVLVIEREATYTIRFKVPPLVIEQAISRKISNNYIQIISGNWGWRSNDFTIRG